MFVFKQSNSIVNIEDPRSKLVYGDGSMPMNHIVAMKKDRGTGANLILATTETGCLGMYALKDSDILPLAASAPIVATPGVAGHSEMIRCAALCNHYVITGAEDSRVCSWTANPLPTDTAAATPAAAAAAAGSSNPEQPSSYRPKPAGSMRKNHGASSAPYNPY